MSTPVRSGRWRLALAALFTLASGLAAAQTPGVSKTEIRLGQSMPYSGNASAYGVVGKSMAAYFEKINTEQGGINGRKITFLSLDDGYSPPKTVEMTRKLVEQEDVLAIVGTLGTPTNTAIHRYLNTKKIPHLFVTTGASKWADPKHFPYTMPGMVSYQTEAAVYGRYLVKERPGAKVAILYQNDDFGKGYLSGFKKGLGEAAARMIVAEQSYEVTDATIDSQMVALKASGADALFAIVLGKFVPQVIRQAHDTGWKPADFIVPTSAMSVKAFLQPAGLDKSTGLVTATMTKVVSDPGWDADPGMIEYRKFLADYLPTMDPNDSSMVTGYNTARLMVQILTQCGEDLSRENVMRQAANLKDIELPMLLPGIKVTTSPEDYLPYQTLKMHRFNGQTWIAFGEPLTK
ncbi:MAG: branched-chain amino acid ABC transporter substrate-binding protein [Hyphomicrobiales bacterium]|nr:MAG: branched-chain amino acid ABC transporter substrate-binding protein [Hyphomicrobiales bacterium]